MLAQNTSDNSILFYRVQIKAIEVSQLLQIQGSRLTENEVKNITNENLNVFGMS